MANVPANIRKISATFTLGADTYTAHIQNYQWNNATDVETVTDISGLQTRVAGTSSHDLTLILFQDWTATGLARLFFDESGEESGTVVIVDGPTTFTAEVEYVMPNAIGGAGNTVGTTTVVLPSTRPVLSATA